MNIGPLFTADGRCEFSVWAPLSEDVRLRLLSPVEKLVPMQRDPRGYWHAVEAVPAGTRYFYRLTGDLDRPDPASHFQPGGVHGPSEVVAHSSFPWEDADWTGIPLPETIIYELHIGTFTAAGTFDEAVARIPELADLGVNAIEIMPVAQFPGDRNWGYDGTYPFAVQNSYGGPLGLKRLVNECHKRGIAVILDVVYNHLGPEGNYLWDFGPYFTGRYKTPWGDAVNFDGPYSDEVRNFFRANALHWFANYHIDGLRLDATHSIVDVSARPFLGELKEKVAQFSSVMGRDYYLIAESDLNDPKAIRPLESGGYGFDALWSEDFHHALHALLTGERQGYYIDFGRSWHLVKALAEGFTYSGQYSEYRKRRHGAPAREIPADRFVAFSQNHDQVGNRLTGDRLSTLVSFEALKLAAGTVLISPYIPLLFMGEEYGEEAPFLYFISHGDQALIEAVRKGRKEEFRDFDWQLEPFDPQAPETFQRSKLRWQSRRAGRHSTLLEFYRRLIALRKEIPALAHLDRNCLDVHDHVEGNIVSLRRWRASRNSQILCFLNFGDSEVKPRRWLPEGQWLKVLDSADSSWQGPGSRSPEILTPGREPHLMPHSLVLYAAGGSDMP